MADESLLGYALLGLLEEEPRSGYDLRKLFATTAMGLFSDSPGAIYPALRRLQRRGWIVSSEQSRRGRRRQTFVPTASGRTELVAWLTSEPTYDDVVRRWDEVMLRLALMTDVVTLADVRRFLDAVANHTEKHLADLELFLEGPGQDLRVVARLAFDCGVDAVRTRVRWAEKARQDIRAKRRM